MICEHDLQIVDEGLHKVAQCRICKQNMGRVFDFPFGPIPPFPPYRHKRVTFWQWVQLHILRRVVGPRGKFVKRPMPTDLDWFGERGK